MASDDVSDFMTEHPGKFVHLIGALNETTIYVDKAAGNGEGIHFLRVDDEKVPVEIATAREPRDRIS